MIWVNKEIKKKILINLYLQKDLVKNELKQNTKYVESIEVYSSPRQIKQDKLNPDIRRVNSEMISNESINEENKVKTEGCKCDCLLIWKKKLKYFK